jgi:hypothetical protein
LICTITTCKKTWKVLGLIAIVLIAFTFLQTQTRAVFVAIFIFITTFLMINKRNIQLKQIILLFSSFIFAIIIGYLSRSIIATIFVGLISYWFLIFVYYQ